MGEVGKNGLLMRPFLLAPEWRFLPTMDAMMTAPLPADEEQRLSNLRSFGVLDTLPQRAFDDITSLAASICDTPIALISLVDQHRQWFKSKVGMKVSEGPREFALCAHAILNPTEVLVIPDALQDTRFVNNPLVLSEPRVRFYAGAPIVSEEGYALGTVCVIDNHARTLTHSQKTALRSLSGLVSSLMAHERLMRETARNRITQAETDNQILNAMVTESLDLKSFVDHQYIYRFVNPSYLRYWGLQTREIIGQPVANLIGHGRFANTVQQHLDRALAGEAVHYEIELDFPAIGRRHMEVSYLPAHDFAGQVMGVVVRCHDVERRKQHENQLTQTVALLEHKTLEQDRFIHIISHDLREPINTINNFASLLVTDEALKQSPVASRYLGFVQAGGLRMKSLLDDLLGFLHMENHAVEKQPIDLTELATAVRDDLNATLLKVHGKIEFDPLPQAVGDRSLLRIALQNLVSNGLKFTAKGVSPVVKISATVENSSILISVSDNGIGMVSAQTAKIFQLFQRLHTQKEYPGTGIGLSICRRIAELHGGQITVTSAPGEGSCFTLTLPVHPEPPREMLGHDYL